jgi:hypothetical protein
MIPSLFRHCDPAWVSAVGGKVTQFLVHFTPMWRSFSEIRNLVISFYLSSEARLLIWDVIHTCSEAPAMQHFNNPTFSLIWPYCGHSDHTTVCDESLDNPTFSLIWPYCGHSDHTTVCDESLDNPTFSLIWPYCGHSDHTTVCDESLDNPTFSLIWPYCGHSDHTTVCDESLDYPTTSVIWHSNCLCHGVSDLRSHCTGPFPVVRSSKETTLPMM